MLSQEYIETLKKLAKKKTWYEQSEEDGKDYMDVQDFCGGNFDDAYAAVHCEYLDIVEMPLKCR